MFDIFASIFETLGSMGPVEFLISVGSALLIGFGISAVYAYKNEHSTGFAMTIGLIPAIVSVVIMVVSGDIGAGIAVAGAFSLVRFRSAPGSAKEIAVIFLSMATGLLIGMGFVTYAALFALIICAAILLYSRRADMISAGKENNKVIKITIPEDLDFNSQIDSVLDDYTVKKEMVGIKSVNMGSMFRLDYKVTLKPGIDQKDLIDQIRIRNGNLEVAILREEQNSYGL